MRFSTAIIEITWPCQNVGRFIVRGSVPATCHKQSYATEAGAIEAILADPWIKSNPDQMIQRTDGSRIERKQSA